MDFEWHSYTEKLRVVAYWWEKQKRKCCICDLIMLPYQREHTKNPSRATIEHVIPKRDGGPNTAGNVRLAHARCNHALGALWGINKVRAQRGQPPLSTAWALQTGARVKSSAWNERQKCADLRGMTAAENARRMKEYLERQAAPQEAP